MKLPPLALGLAAALAFGTFLRAADAPAADASKVEFRGMLVTGGERRFLLSSLGGTKSKWVAQGDAFSDWTVDSFREKDGTLVLANGGGGKLELTMEANKTGEADVKATVADAQRVLEKIHFGEMLGKVLDGQRKAQIDGLRQSLLNRGMDPAKVDELVAKQSKMMDRMWAGVDMKGLQNSMAQIYSEEFSPDQLQGISEFYDTPAGQAALNKAPEIQLKLTQAIMPQLLAAQKQMAAEAKQAAAAKAAAAGANAPAPPAPTKG